MINAAISRLDGDLRIIMLKQSSKTAFRAWAIGINMVKNQNKYFLNLNMIYKAKNNRQH
jgi:hypothetical protein